MPAPRPALLPLLRSRNQLRLLTALLLEPERRFTLSELADTSGVPLPSVSREMANLQQVGIVSAGQERGRKVVGADGTSPIFPELVSLILKTAGPLPVLQQALAGMAGIEQAMIYGSWARRHLGEQGPPPGDVDLLVIGTPEVAEVRRRAEQTSEQLGRDVNVVVVTRREWDEAASGFLQQVRDSPCVLLGLPPDREPPA